MAVSVAVEDMDLEVADHMMCNFCKECLDTCNTADVRGFVTVNHRPDKFYFKVESTGAMPAPQIVSMALEILFLKLRTVHNDFKDIPQVAGALGLAATGTTSVQLDLQ